MKREAEVKFFDTFVEEHGEYDVLGEAAYRRLLALFSKLCRPRPGEKCADCGCGTGAFTRRLVKFDLDLVGIDISPASIRAAQAQATRERYIVGDITNLTVQDETLDILVFSGVLHHFPTASLRSRILAEAFRILKPGGRLFAFDPSAHSPSMWLYRSPTSPVSSKIGKTKNEVLLSGTELSSELRQAGFEAINVGGTGRITYRYVEGRVARSFLPFYNLYEVLLGMSPLERWFGTFLISFGMKASCR